MSPDGDGRAAVSYVLPLRWRDDDGLDELTGYLHWLSGRVEDVLVVDGSDPARFDAHAGRWAGLVRHLRPHPDLHFASGKVDGVVTGVREAAHDRVVIADDDVRYDDWSLARMGALLLEAELVRPQNYFDPLPWHARWDTARTLLNRALGADFPGTLGVRRGQFLAMGGYDGDVLFENLELIRSVEAAGGRVVAPLDLYVRRLPPTTSHFLSQRVRQAYDDFALPARMAAALAVLPGLALTPRGARGAVAAGLAMGATVLAEAGRRRAGGRVVFPASASLLAPAWALERAVCAWLAVGARARWGGVPYGGRVVSRAATPARQLRRRLRRPGAAPARASAS
ncbi:glycosyltransferase [Miltoncostaea marina]|uniref:glycosyltransferase n=1 Tax=Miltoncostaea marina TaxID=2843215 RepID=UPI001C3DB8D6|nr:glycosyltransferase family 2 protein [Miltoncostaea marina]